MGTLALVPHLGQVSSRVYVLHEAQRNIKVFMAYFSSRLKLASPPALDVSLRATFVAASMSSSAVL